MNGPIVYGEKSRIKICKESGNTIISQGNKRRYPTYDNHLKNQVIYQQPIEVSSNAGTEKRTEAIDVDLEYTIGGFGVQTKNLQSHESVDGQGMNSVIKEFGLSNKPFLSLLMSLDGGEDAIIEATKNSSGIQNYVLAIDGLKNYASISEYVRNILESMLDSRVKPPAFFQNTFTRGVAIVKEQERYAKSDQIIDGLYVELKPPVVNQNSGQNSNQS